MPPRLPEPAAVLSGKVRASIEQVFALVHAANPTDRGLSQREKSERYALKSRLQSFLIKHHADVLEVVADGGEGVVSIRHRTAGRDAAHAVVASLDDDARRWVETELALGARPLATLPATASAQKRVRAEPGDALSLGHAAMEAYDYDAAREHFTAALTESRGGLEAARALVELLVHHLADDAEAVALESRLSAQALADADVRSAIALSAARTGDRVRAARLGRGIHSPDLLALLADLALRDGDAGEAQVRMGVLRALDATHPALARIADGVACARREERRPAEEALAQAVERKDVTEAGRLARDLVTRWPDSEPAKRVILECETRERLAEARKLADAAWSAWSQGQPESAVGLARRARALAPEDAELKAWLDEAEEAASEAAAVAARARAYAELREDRFDAYLALDAKTRSAIRAETKRPALTWLESLPRGSSEAVRALERALTAPDHARRLLEPHARVLRGIPEARRLLAEAEARAEEEARAAYVRDLGQAEDAWLTGHVDLAAALLRGLDPRHAVDLRAQELRRTVEADLARRETVERVESLARTGEVVAARNLARASAMPERAESLSEEVVRRFAVEVVHGESISHGDMTLPSEGASPLVWMSPDGERIALVRVVGCHVFVRMGSAIQLEVNLAVSFRVPVPGTGASWTWRDEHTLTIFGGVWVVEVHTGTGEILRWLPPAPSLPPAFLCACLAPDGRHLWVTRDGDPPRTDVFDLEDWPRPRHKDLVGEVVPMLGGTDVVRMVPTGGIVVHTPGGGARSRKPVIDSVTVAAVARSPAGGAIVGFGEMTDGMVTNPEVQNLVRRHGGVCSFVLRDDGMVRFAALNWLRRGDRVVIATAHESGEFWLRKGLRDQPHISICEMGDGDLPVVKCSMDPPPSAVLVQDHAARRVAMVLEGQHHLVIAVRNDGGPPPPPPDGEPSPEVEPRAARLDLDGIVAPLTCAPGTPDPAMEVLADVQALLAGRDVRSADARLRAVDARTLPKPLAQHAAHLDALCALGLGDVARARISLAAATQIPGGCSLGGLGTMIDALDGGGGHVALAEYVRKLLEADRKFAVHDMRGGGELIHEAWMWRAQERQGLVRLGAAWLVVEPKGPGERFLRRLTFASLCGWHDRDLGVDLPLGASTWGPDRWREVVEAARGRLKEE